MPHSQANGQVERVNGVLVPLIHVNIISERLWNQEIQKVQCQINNSFNKTIGDTPFHVLFGYYVIIQDRVLNRLVGQEQLW